MLPLLALGCSFGLNSPGSDTDAGAAPRIDAVEPSSGSSRGGTTVTITGEGFTDAVSVGFGGVWGEVTVIDSSTLAVDTPGIGIDLTVDVTVETSGGVATLPDAFHFTGRQVDTEDDTGEPDDTDTHAGLVGGYVSFEWSDLACPACYGLSSTEPTVTASARFHAPRGGSWLSWLPADGACVSDATPTVLATSTLDAGANVVLNDGARDVVLLSTSGSGGVVYTSSGLSVSSYTAGGTWDIAARGGSGSGGVSAFLLGDALHTPVDFSDIQPSAILTDSTSSAFTTTFGGSAGTPITWYPSGVGDFVLVTLEASRGGTYVGSTTCRSTDDGNILVPASAVSGWTNGDRLAVRIGRYAIDEGELTDGSTVETVGRIERIGTGIVQY